MNVSFLVMRLYHNWYVAVWQHFDHSFDTIVILFPINRLCLTLRFLFTLKNTLQNK